MRSVKLGGLIATCCGLVAALACSGAVAASAPKPKVATGGASHVLVSSALLNATVNPDGVPTSYYFQYGQSTAYGQQTPTVSVGSGTISVKVGQSVVGLLPGVVYHYRVVGVYGSGQLVFGRDRTFLPKGAQPRIELAKLRSVTVGAPFIVSGTLSGLGAAHHTVTLQASAFPYLQPFTAIGLPGSTDALGRFAFRVAHLSRSTQFRVITSDPRPIFSRTLTVPAAVRVTMRVHSSGRPGLVRLSGTVTPAVVRAQVFFQLRKAVRPVASRESEEETATRWVTSFHTVAKKATRSFSRFSLIVKVKRSGRYRAFVKVRPGGPVVSGASTQTVLLHAAPTAKAKH